MFEYVGAIAFQEPAYIKYGNPEWPSYSKWAIPGTYIDRETLLANHRE